MAPVPGNAVRVVQAGVFLLLALVLAVFLVSMETSKLLPATTPDSLLGLPVGDFSSLWAAGVLARDHALPTLYSAPGFTAWKTSAFGPAVTENDWVYPPLVLPLGAGLSLLPVGAGFALWSVLTVGLMAALLRYAGLGWGAVGVTLLSPPALLSLIYGQISGVVACLAFAGLARGQGGLLGLAALKPQIGLLAPLVWLVQGRWRAILIAALTVAVLSLLPLVLFGPQAWALFLTHSSVMARALVQAPFGQGYQLTGDSVLWMLRSFGAGLHLSYAAQAVAALGAAGLTVRVWRGPGDALGKTALTACLGLFIAPYGFSEDMVGYAAALAVAARARGRVSLLDGVLWLWPGYAALVTSLTHHELTPLVVGVAALRVYPAIREKTMASDETGRELVVRREISASRPLVWQALTDPAHVNNWWGPDGFTNQNVTLDFRVGGAWVFDMVGPDGTRYPNRAVFKEITPPHRLVHDHGDGERVMFEFTVTLEETATGTLVTLRQLYPSPEARDVVVEKYGALQGAEQHLAKLEAYVKATL